MRSPRETLKFLIDFYQKTAIAWYDPLAHAKRLPRSESQHKHRQSLPVRGLRFGILVGTTSRNVIVTR